MEIGLVMPALAMIVTGTLAGVVKWPLAPRHAIRVLTAIAAVTASTAAALVAFGSLGLLVQTRPILNVIDAALPSPLHHSVDEWAGLLAVVLLAFMAVRVCRALGRRRHILDRIDTTRRLSILETEEPIAFAAPGDPGCVVVSRGMLHALEPRERQVLFAHERAHLSQRHHRYLLVGELAVAVLPPLRPLIDQLQLATERCADEAAAVAVAGDRRLVARTIAKAAITKTNYHGLVGALAGSSVPARVEALVCPPPSRLALATGSTLTSTIAAAVVALSSIQMHHLAELVAHFTHG